MSDMTPLGRDALSIWSAGVDAVRSERLMRGAVSCSGGTLTVCGELFPLDRMGRIAVVGGGKAGAGMGAAFEEILGPDLVDSRVTGWINVPADCVRPLRRIHLHAARPAGVNEPTEAGVAGSRRILEIVSQLEPHDFCLVFLSGGGSALLPAPIPEISLGDKQAVTRFLMHAGATIFELNAVRKQLSQIKGGRLAQGIRADVARGLIISDVVGDPLDVIASGPTVPDTSTPRLALEVLQKFSARPPTVPQSVFDALERAASKQPEGAHAGCAIRNHVIGNSAMAVAAAAERARDLGYSVQSLGSDNQGEADAVGRELAERCLAIRDEEGQGDAAVCLLSGGEPVVHFRSTGRRGKGGRNQQLVLAAVDRLWNDDVRGLTLLSGGTDGEDGPTDAAGAYADERVFARARAARLSPREFLEHNDAYSFFDPAEGLIRTGPTHTNVMDLRVALVRKRDEK